MLLVNSEGGTILWIGTNSRIHIAAVSHGSFCSHALATPWSRQCASQLMSLVAGRVITRRLNTRVEGDR